MELTGKLSAEPTIKASLSATGGLSGSLSSNVHIKLQTKSVIPKQEGQTIVADDGYAGLSAVSVAPIPSDYGHIVFNGSYLLVE